MYRARSLGRRWFGDAFDHVLFLRPRQWPILTVQFLVGVVAAPALAQALAGGRLPGLREILLGWAAWVLGLNGGTLAFNSAFDRDEQGVAYLDDPPPPPPGLARTGLLLMLAGAAAAWTVAPSFGIVTAACVALSVLYSHPAVRLKSRAGWDLAVNMVGYGAGTTLAGLFVGRAAAGAAAGGPGPDGWYLTCGFALLFGSFYPLTQLYQIRSDRERGDRTLATALGVRRSLLLAILLGVAAAFCLLAAGQAWSPPPGGGALPLLGAAVAWNVMLGMWRRRGPAMGEGDHERWMYIALLVWALVDLAVVAARFGPWWAGGQS